MSTIKLTYFDIDGGRGEPTRIALSIGGIEFEDHRISFSEFGQMRAGTPFNAVPTLEINEGVYGQSNAMNRYFGRQAGLYPEDPWQAFLCDEAMDAIEDLLHLLVRTFGMQGDELKAARGKLVDGAFTTYLKTLNARLEAAGGEYFADGRLTVADLKVFVWIRTLKSGLLDYVPTDLTDRIAPALVQHMERVAADPGVAAYYEGRGNQQAGFFILESLPEIYALEILPVTYRLYYADGSAAMGARVVLEEIRAPYELIPTSISMGSAREPNKAVGDLNLNPN